jgi:hypothetical protein
VAEEPKRVISSRGPDKGPSAGSRQRSREWEAQFPDPAERAAWSQIFQIARDAAYWKHSGVTPEFAEKARRKGWSRDEAVRRLKGSSAARPRPKVTGPDPSRVPKTSSPSGHDAPPPQKLPTDWLAAGFKSLDDAAPWVSAGWTPLAAERWRALGFGAEMARILQRGGYSPDELRRSQAVLNRAEAKLLRLSEPQARSHGETGAAVDSLSLILAKRLTALGLNWSLSQTFSDGFSERSRSVVNRGVATFWTDQSHPSLEWLSEVLAHAHTVRHHLHRAPVWPVVFEGEVTIDLDVRGSTAVAWVGRDDTGVLVSFDTVNFDTRCNLDLPEERYALGLAISWFVDCVISIGGSSHPHFRPATASESNRRSRRTIGQRYAPTPSFRKHSGDIRSIRVTPPRAHRVAGHVRTLPWDQTPTPEARGQAPPHVRVALRPNQTFVRAHVRGRDDHAPAVLRRLSKYSLLADSLGMAERL